MKKSNRLILLGGVVGLMLTAVPPLFADMGMWPDADSNKDGSIDRAEFDAGRANHFKAVDGNADGFLSTDELTAFHDQHRHETGGERAGMGAKFLKRLDADGDRKVTLAEWQADSLKKFGELDSNADGVMTADEFENMRRPRGGKPGDMADGMMGEVMTGEGMGKPWGDFKDGLARLDTDKDGKISATEWKVLGDRMFARMDDNKDGKINADELPRRGKGKQPQDGVAPVLP